MKQVEGCNKMVCRAVGLYLASPFIKLHCVKVRHSRGLIVLLQIQVNQASPCCFLAANITTCKGSHSWPSVCLPSPPRLSAFSVHVEFRSHRSRHSIQLYACVATGQGLHPAVNTSTLTAIQVFQDICCKVTAPARSLVASIDFHRSVF